MVNVCGRGWEEGGLDNADHCIARAAWLGPSTPEQWRGSGPVQLGGLAHPVPHPADHGWTTNLIGSPLTGCLSHFMVNGQVSLNSYTPVFYFGRNVLAIAFNFFTFTISRMQFN